MPPRACKVGVFVNATAAEIRKLAEAIGLDLIQLHGDEPPDMLRQLRGLPILRAFRAHDDLTAAADYLASCHRLACVPRMVLVDSHSPVQYGGTGATADWQALASHRARLAGMPLVLAGGLTSQNVAEAILTVRPWAVDTASGVETSPGQKSPQKMQDFVEAAKAALARSATAR